MRFIAIILIFLVTVSSVGFTQSLSEKKELKRTKPKNNTLSKVLGVGAAAGAVKIATQKSSQNKGAYNRRPYTMNERKMLVTYFDRVGTYRLNYRFGTNNKSGIEKIDQYGVEFSFKMPHNFTLNYRNKEYLFSDNSFLSINQYFLDYALMPLLSGKSVSQVGAFVGGKSTRSIPSALEVNHDVIFGLYYDWHNLSSIYSLHARYFSSVTNIKDFTMDSLTEVYARFYWEFLQVDAGAELDLTDMEDIDTAFFGRIGVKF